MSPPLLADLEELIAACDKAIEQIIGSHVAEDEAWRLEDFRDALGTVRGIRFAIRDWVDQAKRQPVADMTPKGGFGEHH